MRCLSVLFFLLGFEFSFSQTSQTFNASGSFTVPAGVYVLEVDAWGAGGAGGILTGGAKGGGGGGAFATRSITVIPGTTYTITVGTGGIPTASVAPSGGSSSFGSLVIAAGGAGASGTNGGNGGLASACTPTIGAISGVSGSNASGNNGGTGGAGANGGSGGAGGLANNGDAGPGNQPGGGGGGKAGPGAGALSGPGGDGRVVVTYTTCSAPTVVCAANVTVNAIAPACSATVTLTRPTISNVCYRNHSLDFDGTNDYVALPSGLTSTFTNFTFEAWVYWDGPTSSTWQRIMDFGNNTNVNMFLTPSSDSGTPRFAITTTGGGGEQRLTSSAALTTGQWHHFAVVLDDASNTGNLYINGVRMAQNTSITLTPASLGSLANNWLGRSQYADPYFNGKIDEVRIWNTTRTQAQIQANMNNEFASMPSGLIAYYKFNNGISCCSNAGLTTLANESGSNNGSLTNFSLATGCTSNWSDGATPLGNPLTLSNSFNSSCVVTSGSFPAGVNNVTWTVTDGYGNTSTCVQTVTVNETQVPSITCPANISTTVVAGTCGRTVTFTSPVGSDNCSGPITIQTAGLASGSSYPVGITTNTFRVTDAAGNTATCSFTVTVTDNDLPSITCPANVSQNVTSGTCGAAATYTAPVGTDNCPGSTTLQTAGLASGATYPVGVTTNTFRVTDASGNTATCSFTVTVADNILPVITCPLNVTTNVAAGTCSRVVVYTSPTGTDNCPSATTTQIAGLASGVSYPRGTTTNSFRVTDASGNSATCSFTVTVVDNELPVITCPANISQNVTTGTCGRVVTYTSPVGSDNCAGPITIQTAGLASGSTYPVGVTTNTFRVTDASGNTATCSFTVTVVDNEAPTIVFCPTDFSVGLSSDPINDCMTMGNWSPPIASDNCPGVIQYFSNYGPHDLLLLGDNMVEYEIIDQAGNINATCTFTVSVFDDNPPVISYCPADVTIHTSDDGLGNCSSTFNWIEPEVIDDCDGSLFPINQSHFSGEAFVKGTTQIIYEFMDNESNAINCEFTITVVDNELPAISCPPNISTGTNVGQCSALVSFLVLGGTDNCPGSYTGQIAGFGSGSMFPLGTTTNIYRVTDEVGNTATCSFTITVVDNIFPSIVCPDDIAVNTAAGVCSQTVNFSVPVGTDNCLFPTTIQTLGLGNGAIYPVGQTTNIYRVTDGSGNSSTCSFNVNVTDNQLPEIDCPNNILVNTDAGMCTAVVNYVAPVGTDNCSGSTTILLNGLAGGSAFPNQVTTVLYQVTDASGNTATCDFTVTVVDAEIPTAICQNATAYLNAGGTVTVSASQINNGSSDACGLASLVLNNGSWSCANVGPNGVVLTVTDVNANTSTCSATVTVQDTIKPIAVCQNITAYLSAGGTVTVSATQINNGSSDACGLASLALNNGSWSCDNVGPNGVVLTVTDVNANTSTCSATVTVQDTIKPVAVCQNITAYLNAAGTATVLASQINNGSSDACGLASLTLNNGSWSCANVGSNGVVLTVTDVNANTSTCSATVMILDTIKPVAICQNITAYLNAGGTATVVASQINNGSSDACGLTSLTLNNGSWSCANVGSNGVVLTVTDVNANTSTCSATVMVLDTIKPFAICQNITAYLNAGGTATVVASQINNGSSDACGLASLTLNNGSWSCANVGSNGVVLTVTDVNANTSTCSATVMVLDTIKPFAICQNITAYLNAGGTATVVASQINNGSSDACGLASLALNNGSWSCTNVGTNGVVLTVTDVNGNSASCTAFVTIVDTIAPTTPVLSDVLLGECGGSPDIPVASDVCGGMIIATTTTNFPITQQGLTVVTWIFDDGNGNISTVDQNIMVDDITAPIVPLLPTITSDCLMPVTVSPPQSMDNCVGLITATTNDPLFYDAIGDYTINWTFNDGNGNTASTIQIVQISNAGAPVVINGQCFPSINAALTSGVVLGDVIHAYGNNLLESFEIPAGVTLAIHTGAVVINSGMVCNNGMILISGGTYINSGTYAGQGTFNGNFVNNVGGVVKPGPCGN